MFGQITCSRFITRCVIENDSEVLKRFLSNWKCQVWVYKSV